MRELAFTDCPERSRRVGVLTFAGTTDRAYAAGIAPFSNANKNHAQAKKVLMDHPAPTFRSGQDEEVEPTGGTISTLEVIWNAGFSER